MRVPSKGSVRRSKASDSQEAARLDSLTVNRLCLGEVRNSLNLLPHG